MRTFQAYDWPGNVRELKHCVERMMALRSEGALRVADMPSALQNFVRGNELQSLAKSVEQPDAELPRLPADAVAASGDLDSRFGEAGDLGGAGGDQRRAGEGGVAA